jgi:aryl-alcohol dehydrogenase-like predicted oxidoreductase
MNQRRLGKTGYMVSEVGYGAWGIGGKQWRGSGDDEAFGSLRRAVELGLNFIDTALAYGDGHSEELIGAFLKETRASVRVATKVPPKNQLWPAQPGIQIDQVFPVDYVVASTEQSLRNLQVDCLDLQQFHVWNPEWIARDEWRTAIEKLKQAGKVRYFGISINDHQPDSALEAVATGLIDTVQVIYNVFDQSPERNLFLATQQFDVGVLARCPFDEGSLTGSVTESSVFEPGEFRAWYFRGDHKRQVVEHVSALQADLAAAGAQEPLADTALRFCLSTPAVTTVIPGMRRVYNVERNCGVSQKGPLPKGILQVVRRHAWEKNFYS